MSLINTLTTIVEEKLTKGREVRTSYTLGAKGKEGPFLTIWRERVGCPKGGGMVSLFSITSA